MRTYSKPGFSLGQLLFAGLLIVAAICAVCYQASPGDFNKLQYSPVVQEWTGR